VRFDLVEINISSPNTKLVYEWSTRPTELRGLLHRDHEALELSRSLGQSRLLRSTAGAVPLSDRAVNWHSTWNGLLKRTSTGNPDR